MISPNVIARHKEQKVHPVTVTYILTDPRSDKIFQIANEGGVGGEYIELVKILAEELSGANR